MAQVGYMIDPAKLRHWRLRNRLSQRALADRIGMSEGYVWMLEKERRRPSGETVGRLERVLGCTAADLGVSEDELPGRPLDDEGSADTEDLGERPVVVAVGVGVQLADCLSGG